jgi:ESS family glutamate:Na+ symporter
LNSLAHTLSIGTFFQDVGLIGMALVVALGLHAVWRRSRLLPASIVAGLLMLGLGPTFLGVLQSEPERFGHYLYHLLGLTFTAVGLQRVDQQVDGRVVKLSLWIALTIGVQGVLGLSIGMLGDWITAGAVDPLYGFMLPLGFGNNPGFAYTMGTAWEALGVEDASAMGLVVGALGFAFAYLHGVPRAQRYLAGSGWDGKPAGAVQGSVHAAEARPPAGYQTTRSSSLDSLTTHLAVVGTIYALTLFLLVYVTTWFESAGLMQVSAILWSLHFLLANVLASVVRPWVSHPKTFVPIDLQTMQRISGLFADLMIVTSLAAITASFPRETFVWVGVLVIVGALVTYHWLQYLVRLDRSNAAHVDGLAMYCQMTGTLASSLAVARVMDPDYKTSLASDLARASALSLVFGLPMIGLMVVPITVFDRSLSGYAVTLVLLAAYVITLFVTLRYVHRSK